MAFQQHKENIYNFMLFFMSHCFIVFYNVVLLRLK